MSDGGPVCARCGGTNTPRARFCRQCGGALESAVAMSVSGPPLAAMPPPPPPVPPAAPETLSASDATVVYTPPTLTRVEEVDGLARLVNRQRRNRRLLVGAGFLAAVALLGLGIVVLGGDQAERAVDAQTATSSRAVSTTSHSTTDESTVVATGANTTLSPTSIVSVAPTSPPMTTAVATSTTPSTGPSPAGTPTVPSVTPTRGPGSPQVLSDPLPSGVVYLQVAESLRVAQMLADALANDVWSEARRLEPTKSGFTDQQFLAGYDGLDRASLLLVDARAEGAGHRLLVVSVANELDGSRTTLFCLEWTVDPGLQTVRQNGRVVGQIGRVPFAISPEAVRSDPGLDALVRSQCVWS